jgi:hypothetical protein
MKLDFAFLADAAYITDDGLFCVVGGGFDIIFASGFPAIKHAMALVGRVVFEASEFGKVHLLHGEIVGPNDSLIPPDLWLSLKPFPPPTGSGRDNWMTICLNYQGVAFPTPGEYCIRLSVGNQKVGDVKIHVLPQGAKK